VEGQEQWEVEAKMEAVELAVTGLLGIMKHLEVVLLQKLD
jgi:hypothetical protein